jgi:RNA polymerase sigma-70 factor, ECF subfamily
MSASLLDFEQIHADFRPRIERYLTRLVGESEAEDLTQEVFVRISRALPDFRGEAMLSTWIYRIATNAALDRLRSPAYKRIVDGGAADRSLEGEECVDQDSQTQEVSSSIEHLVFRLERFKCYQRFVERLPENYRMVVALSELEDLAAPEIADILGLSVDVVKIRLHRGRIKLLEQLKAHCRPEDWL